MAQTGKYKLQLSSPSYGEVEQRNCNPHPMEDGTLMVQLESGTVVSYDTGLITRLFIQREERE